MAFQVIGFARRSAGRLTGAPPDAVTLFSSDGALLPVEDTTKAEKDNRLRAVCVKLTIAFAEKGRPITEQKRLDAARLAEPSVASRVHR